MGRQGAVVLDLNVVTPAGAEKRPFAVRRIVNAGYVGRDRQAVQAHIDELAREGVAPPPAVPMTFAVSADNITTAGSIEVASDRTSGEIEYVLFLAGQEVLVGIGSDHTDRAAERFDIALSKQVCKNVVSPDVWRLADVEAGWDDLVMQSWAQPVGGEEVLYQKAELRKIIPPRELIELVKGRLVDGDCEGMVIYSGTVAILTKEMIFGQTFRVELADSKLGRKLSCRYDVNKLDYLK